MSAPRRGVSLARAAVASVLLPSAILFAGASPATDRATLLEDLTGAIKVLGLPCGRVIRAVWQADNDHVAICMDGNRYRVFLNAQGRVVAHKQ